MSRTLSLQAVATVTLDASGNGTASVGPTSTREIWSPGSAAVSVSTQVNEATCLVYSGNDASAAYLVDGTYNGSTGNSTTNFTNAVYVGQRVFATWTGGDAGSIATLVVTGTRQIP